MITNPQDFHALLAQDKKQSKMNPAPLPDLLTSDLVSITVGDPVEKTYHVHRTLLCAKDPVFNAGYGPDSQFTEAQKSELKLTDQLPQVADLFVLWLYSDRGKLPIIKIGGHDLPAVVKNSLPAYIHLYTFADSRCIEVLKAEASHEIVNFYVRMEFFVLEPTLCLVYEITPSKCRLRQFMARAWVWSRDWRNGIRNLGKDLVLAMTSRAAGQWETADDGFFLRSGSG
jgi:hypothetical protein